jgi:hypothetical protein
MHRTKTVLLIGCVCVAVTAGGLFWPARGPGAEPPKGGQKWEYAALEYEEPADTVGSRVLWTAGQKVLGGRSEKFLLECVSKLNKELGGKEETANVGVLLNRIGQAGWELVTYARVAGQRGVTHTWAFKRPAP